MPPAQPARSHALPMLTAALTASPAKPGGASDGAAERVAYAPRPPPQQQDGGAPTLASDEAGAGQRPGIGPSAPSQDSRPLPRRALASGGRSGDPVLLESFLNAGMHATSAEVRGTPMAQCNALAQDGRCCEQLYMCGAADLPTAGETACGVQIMVRTFADVLHWV